MTEMQASSSKLKIGYQPYPVKLLIGNRYQHSFYLNIGTVRSKKQISLTKDIMDLTNKK